MSKSLIGIAAVASGLALLISMSANAAPAHGPNQMGQGSKTHGSHAQSLSAGSEAIEGEGSGSNRFPLMLPQPTKVEGQNKYDLG